MATVHRIGFTELSTTRGRDEPYRLNIIFVHGLKGHPQSTWEDKPDSVPTHVETPSRRSFLRLSTRSKPSKGIAVDGETLGNQESSSKVFWPRDFLPADIPNARVWTYGYNADVIGGIFKANNQNSVSQHGQDLAVKFEREIDNQEPVVFVAHSFGGIVVKDALQRSEICRSRTQFVVFLGTPHRGSSFAGWGTIASNLASLALQDSNKKLLKTLEVNGEVLDNIQEAFQRILQGGDLRIHSFQEARGVSGVRGFRGKVVEDFSSKLDLSPPFQTVESIDADHMQMARCRTRADPQYRAIAGVLKQFTTMCGEAHGGPASAPARQQAESLVRGRAPMGFSQSCYHIQLGKNSKFTGRNATLECLEKKLFAPVPCRRLALVGLGGAGKTQIALQFAYNVKETRPEISIFWVPVLSSSSVEQAYTDIATKLGLQKRSDDENIQDLVCRHLDSGEAGQWLLVVDNADDQDLVLGSADEPGLEDYLPRSGNGSIMLTTRSRQVAVEFAQVDVIDVELMDDDEAEDLLQKSLIQKQPLQNKVLVTELLVQLTRLPLAITQAAAYLNQTMLPMSKYLALLRSAEKDAASILEREFRDNTRYRGSRNAVATTWIVSFEQIQKANETAIELLSFMSCIEPKAIPQSLLPGRNSEELEWAIGTLCGYSFLVRRADTNVFDMHSLVHMATRGWVEKTGRQERVLQDTVGHLLEAYPSSDRVNRELWREYLPHALRILDRSEKHKTQARSHLARDVGRCLYEDRRFSEAIRCFEETVQWHRDHSTAEDHDRLASEHELARTYEWDRRIGESIEILEHVVAVKKETLEETNPLLLSSEHELAWAYLSNRRIQDAIKMLEHVVEIRKKTLKEADHDRLASEHALASTYLTDRRTKEAIEILEHVVAVEKKTLEESDFDRLVSVFALARAYLDDRQTKKAIEMLEYVVAIRSETLEETDHSRLSSEHELARAYLDDRRVKEAIEILERIIIIEKETLKETDFSRLASEHALGRAYLADRRIKEAIEKLEYVTAIERETLKESDNLRLQSEDQLARAYLDDRRIKEAIELLEHVVTVHERTLTETDYNRLASERVLADAYLRDGCAKKAIAILKHVVEVERQLYGEGAPEREVSAGLLAQAYEQLER